MRDESNYTAEEALQRLKDGNERFLQGKASLHGLRIHETLAELVSGQRPYATILGCSDSRVPPESIFHAGLGELFVIRVAGNVMSHEVAGSIQYASSHLETPLIVVLGHEGCGAVRAALATKYKGAKQHTRIQILVDNILPAMKDLDPGLKPRELMAQAIELNVRWTVKMIMESPEGKARQAEGLIKCIGAVYEIETGRVRFLE
jgi:carbonic anhydrase